MDWRNVHWVAWQGLLLHHYIAYGRRVINYKIFAKVFITRKALLYYRNFIVCSCLLYKIFKIRILFCFSNLLLFWLLLRLNKGLESWWFFFHWLLDVVEDHIRPCREYFFCLLIIFTVFSYYHLSVRILLHGRG